MVVRFVCVIRVPVCARESRVFPAPHRVFLPEPVPVRCPGSPRRLFTGTMFGRNLRPTLDLARGRRRCFQAHMKFGILFFAVSAAFETTSTSEQCISDPDQSCGPQPPALAGARKRVAAARKELDDVHALCSHHLHTFKDAEERARAATKEAEAARALWREVEKRRVHLEKRWRQIEADMLRASARMMAKDPKHVHSPSPTVYVHPEAVDYYAVLQVAPGTAMAGIKRAYRERSKQLHPDKRSEADTAQFLRVARAHEILTHPGLRYAYDRGENVDDPKVEKRILDGQPAKS
jgi:DnaJ-domain-containing protein 1